MTVFRLVTQSERRGYNDALAAPCLHFVAALFRYVDDDGDETDAGADDPLPAVEGLALGPGAVSPAALVRLLQSPVPVPLPARVLAPPSLTDAQTARAWRYRCALELFQRPDGREFAGAVLRSGFDVFADPLAEARAPNVIRAVAMSHFSGAGEDVGLLMELVRRPEDRKVIQELFLFSRLVDEHVAKGFINRTSRGADGQVHPALMHRVVVNVFLRREILTGHGARAAAWMNRHGLGHAFLVSSADLGDAAGVAAALESPVGAQILFNSARKHGNTALCKALICRRPEISSGPLAALVKRIQDLDVAYRGLRRRG
eukprot:jgi/Tetstr1/454184/TSEL_041103.t1